MRKVTEQMVDAAARAMAESEGFNWVTQDFNGTPNGNDPEEERNYRRDMARAALEAALPQGEAVAFAKDGVLYWNGYSPFRDGESCQLYTHPQPAPQSEPVVINLAVKKRIVSDRPEGMSCDYVYGWNDCVNTLAATGKQSGIDPSWSLHDRVEFALRDSGFDLDEASRIALLADGKQSGSERERFEAWLSERPYMSFAGYAWEAWQAATASRETVGVEPVAVIGSDFTICWVGSGPIAPLVERNGIKKGSFLYAAPPAQGVDLGQFRANVAELLRSEFDLEAADPEDHRHDDGSAEADRIANKIASMIDQRDGEK